MDVLLSGSLHACCCVLRMYLHWWCSLRKHPQALLPPNQQHSVQGLFGMQGLATSGQPSGTRCRDLTCHSIWPPPSSDPWSSL